MLWSTLGDTVTELRVRLGSDFNDMRNPSLTLQVVQELASSVGLAVVAVGDSSSLEADKGLLEAWQAEGYAGELLYMERDAGLLASPRRLLPSARSVVVFGVPYDATPSRPLTVDEGRVARYAWGRDYHRVLRKRLESFVSVVQGHLASDIEYRLFSDSVPLLERALARRSGLGFIGKNTMLIVPKLGSFLFLGEILWAVDVEVGVPREASPLARQSAGCGSCSRCLDACPTQAFVSERILDARRCISYLTIEKRGALSVQEREWLGEWIFGCDLCQEVCPHNFVSIKRGRKASIPELSAQAGVGEALSLSAVLAMRSDEAFQSVFAGTAIMRAKRAGLLRNAAIVGANKHAVHLLGALQEAATQDLSPSVRQHALWALSVIAVREGQQATIQARRLLERALRDEVGEVRQEAELLLPNMP